MSVSRTAMRPSRVGFRRSLWLSSWRLAIVFVVVVWTVVCGRGVVVSAQKEEQEEEKVTWTANPTDGQDDGGGPLPLSMNQRQQLVELENTIRQSPDPTATLQKVAAANNMDAQHLANILQRNRSDLMMQGGGGGDARPLSALHNPATRLLGAVVTVLKRHPKSSAAVLSTLLVVWYLKYIEIPRTGLCLSTSSSSNRSWFTRGTTTVLPPPQAFVERLLRRVQDNDVDDTLTMVRIDNDQYQSLLEIVPTTTIIEPGQVQTIKAPGRKTSWKRAYVAEQTISLPRRRRRRRLLTQSNDDDDDGAEERSNGGEDDDVANDDDDDDDVEDILLDQASRLLTDPAALVEWIPGVRVVVSPTAGGDGDDDDGNNDDENGDTTTSTTAKTKMVMLIYPGFGDFRRYALMSFIVASSPPEPEHQRRQDDPIIIFDPQQRLVLQTTKGTYFDGQLVVDIIAPNRVRVSMIVERGRAPPQTFLQDLAHSIAKSVQARTRQVLARRAQSDRYRATSHAQMAKRRAQRDQKAREMEEMNANRRRKWQRSHPNAKHNYRPSGQRMRSPNNAIYQ